MFWCKASMEMSLFSFISFNIISWEAKKPRMHKVQLHARKCSMKMICRLAHRTVNDYLRNWDSAVYDKFLSMLLKGCRDPAVLNKTFVEQIQTGRKNTKNIDHRPFMIYKRNCLLKIEKKHNSWLKKSFQILDPFKENFWGNSLC